MAKELPYFRFTVQEWQNGNISLESYELKGLFIDVCSYYWIQNCSITLAMLNKRFKDAKNLIEQLIELEIIKVDTEDFIIIHFLNKQLEALSENKQKRSEAGRKGGLKRASNAKAMLKQSLSYKDKDKDKDKYKDKGSKNKFLQERKILNNTFDLFPKDITNNLTDTAKEKWLDAIRKLHELDGEPYDIIEKVIKHGRNTEFWQTNFLSVLGLRKKKDGVMKYSKIKADIKDLKTNNYQQEIQELYGNDR